MLFVPPDFAEQKRRVQNKTRDDQRKEYNAENHQRDLAQIEQNPADIERNRHRDQADSENEKEYGGFTSSHVLTLNEKRR